MKASGAEQLFSDTLWRETRVRLEPEVVSSAQQWAMGKWRVSVEHAQCGIDLQDGLPKPLDLRFADDIFLFARFLLESLMKEFAEVGPLLNGDKTVVLTNGAQPLSHLWTQTAPQSPQPNAFDKSKLEIHAGMFAARVLSRKKLAVSKCSCKRRPARKPCCSSGWCCQDTPLFCAISCEQKNCKTIV